MKYQTTHTYTPMEPDMRPQDPDLRGETLTFKTLEHGGSEPDTFPNAVKITDAEGRWCIYLPTEVRGEVVQSHGFSGGPVKEPIPPAPVS